MELLMYRVLAAAGALSVTLATAGVALAQTYPAPTYPPPNAGYYPPAYAAPAPPPAYYQPPPVYSDPHSGGGAGREYPYGGGPKPD
jgi:hypothetical protein